MTEFRTDAAFSSISGTLIPTSEYLNCFNVTRLRNGRIRSVHVQDHIASLKHHRLVHDRSVYNFSFPVISPYNYFKDDNDTIFLPGTQYQYITIFEESYSPVGDHVPVTIASAFDTQTNAYVDYLVDSNFNYFLIGNDAKPSSSPASYSELSRSTFYILPFISDFLILPDGLFIGQQLSIVRDINVVPPFIVSSQYTPLFSEEHFSDSLLIVVWDGTSWKKLTLSDS